jgi:CRISPR type III-associated protein (TIGR04423 family)
MKTRYNNEEKVELIKYINSLDGYRGYVQFSDRPLEQKDLFENTNPNVASGEKGFIYEAHFSNAQNSIMIRQQNAEWVVSETIISDVKEKDMEYFALEKTTLLTSVKSNWVKMAQIWKSEADEFCDGMEVMKLQKVVFAGFEKEKK